jgi:hypothetical protein
VLVQRALNHIAESPEGAKALIDADVFGSLPELLNSDSRRKWTVDMLGTLATHGFRFGLPSRVD